MTKKLGWPILGASLLAVGGAMSDFGNSADAAPDTKTAQATNVCAYDAGLKKLVIHSATDPKIIKGGLIEAFEAKDRVVTGQGVIYPKPNQVGIEEGIKFTANFKTRSCEVRHVGDSFGYDALKAPMVPDLKSYTFTIR